MRRYDAQMIDVRASAPDAAASDEFICRGTPAFRRVNLALFAAGFATFGLLYCVQPLLPEFTRDYGVSEAVSALSLSLTTFVLVAWILFDQRPGASQVLGFVLIALGALVIFKTPFG